MLSSRSLGIAVAILSTLVGCQRESSPPSSPATKPTAIPQTQAPGQAPAPFAQKPRARVKVMRDGTIFVDDQLSTPDALDQRFRQLAAEGGAVWYYREGATEAPHPNAMLVIERVAAHHLPITLSTRPDYSDYVDGQNQTHPRKSGP